MATQTQKTTKTSKRPGVIACIIEVLSRGTKDKPVKREDIFTELCRRFPGRDPAHMKSTINTQLGSGLWDRGIIVLGNAKEGYYLIK